VIVIGPNAIGRRYGHRAVAACTGRFAGARALTPSN